MATIDLNSDLGEGAGTEAAIMPLITSANIACGAHAGDERSMRETLQLAIANKVAPGAHPGYRDPASFGRLALDIPADELTADLVVQIDALRKIARSEGTDLAHVKAHGALYNTAQLDEGVAAAIVAAVRQAVPRCVLFVFPGSAVERAARAAGLRVAREGFIDRTYEADGTLRSRTHADALITDPERAATQALSFVRYGGVRARDGTFLRLDVDTLCVHGDTPGAPAILRAARAALVSADLAVRRLE
ncbi:MAG TPA: 5-oxoprolinase subunit PxpA [Candidatus Limnocylindria bacterium]|nr:5-oxoprolinase subunit PxpA [Candidatus Limnocylindria bacterium]